MSKYRSLSIVLAFWLTPLVYLTGATSKPPLSDFAPGEPSGQTFPPAYNAAAAVVIHPNSCKLSQDLNAFATLSFLYWHASESGLNLATNGILVTSSGTLYYPTAITTFTPSFEYKPGFKAGIGLVGIKEWVVSAEYTWLHGHTSVTKSAPTSPTLTAGIATSTASSGTSVWVINDWFLQGTTQGQALSGGSISGKWKYGLDLLDLLVSRPYYQGTCLTIEPALGVRAAWIRQTMTVDLNEASSLFGTTLPSSEPTQPISSVNQCHSWGIGPKIELNSNYLFPMGFRFEGACAASLLYTRYTKIYHTEDAASTGFNPGPYSAALDNYSALRPIGDLNLGIGWGKYLQNKKFHIDCMASYDFSIFWEQNMIRSLLDDSLTGTGSTPGNLYFHGLTILGRFDF